MSGVPDNSSNDKPGYSYQGLEWFDCHLPTIDEPWSIAGLSSYVQSTSLKWRGRRVYFVTDIHADTDAFFLSLVASGGVAKTGPGDHDFELTEQGRSAVFVLGGDYFDKGPENLRLLEAIHQLYLKGAEVDLLAGNHDVRTYLGIFYAESKETMRDHLFIRMGEKTVPLLNEIYETFVVNSVFSDDSETDESVKKMLYPAESWYREYPKLAAPTFPQGRIEKEVRRIREKTIEFEARASEFGLTLKQIYQAVKKFRELFVTEEGRYFWFFERMKLAHLDGSFLFVHAGLDDSIARLIQEKGVDYINEEFRRMLRVRPYEFYHGELGNTIRTKYRDIDYTLTQDGVDALHSSGIHALVHGHRKLRQGQQLVIRNNMLNFECDASVDRNTRAKDGLIGIGGAAVVFEESGRIFGISTDYPFIKSLAGDE